MNKNEENFAKPKVGPIDPDLKIGGAQLQDDYYENYNSIFDLEMMGGRIKDIELPEQVLEQFRNKEEKRDFLVLGSATTKNINGITKIAHYLHGKDAVQNDSVNIVDINEKSIAIHQKAIDELDEESDWTGKTMRETSAVTFPYPQFKIEKGDIRALPNESNSADVVVSDYTINYLDSLEDVAKCFREVGRVLKDNGLLFITLRYSKDSPEKITQGNIPICKFTLSEYEKAAATSGLTVLKEESQYETSNDILIVFEKID